MANRIARVGDARIAARRRTVDLARDLREARFAAGLRQGDIARALGLSASQIGRVERGEQRRLPMEDVAAYAAAVGMRLSVSLYPAGGRLRDGRQLKMIEEYRRLIEPGSWHVKIESPVGPAGDLRAFDLLLSSGRLSVAHEFVSRMRDVQAQIRPLMLKQRDAGVDRLVLVVAATHGNRRAVAEAGPALHESFPLGTRAVLAALRAGRDPGGNGLVFI